MKKQFLLLLLCTSPILLNAQLKRKVLFLGNSYTEFNNLPQLIANVAANKGDTLIYDSHTPGGYTLEGHSMNSTSMGKVKAGGWDYVVLQEQSQLPSFEFYSGGEGYGLSKEIRKYNPCARPLFYMTWGRKNGDAGNCAVWPPVCTYKGMDSLIRLRYIEMAEASEAQISPVGAAWRYVRENYPGIELYQPDESHPSEAGSYLAALCFYTSIFRKDPSGISYNYTLNGTVAAQLRTAAKKVVYDSLSSWDYNKYAPKAAFKIVIGKGINEISVVNSSESADLYYWDFGDGATSTDFHSSHNYLGNGKYKIRLIASDCDLGTTYRDTAELEVSFCSYDLSVFPEDLTLCPGKPDTIRTQEYDSYQWLNEDGDSIPGANQPYFIPQGYSYYSVVVSKNSCIERSAPVFVGVHNTLQAFFVDVKGKFQGTDTVCIGDTLLLVLTPMKPPYHADKYIQWFRNGDTLADANNDSIYITEGGKYKVELKHDICDGLILYRDSFNYTFRHCTENINELLTFPGKIYPNPVKTKLFIELHHSHTLTYKVYETTGRQVLNGVLEQTEAVVDLSGLPPGVYFLGLEGYAKTVKIIKL